MRRSLVSRVYVVVYLGVVATLLGLLVPAWLHYRQAGTGAERTAPPAATAPRAGFEHVTPTIRTVPPATPTATTARSLPQRRPVTQRKPVAPSPKLVVAAVRGRCWVSVREGAATADVLYEGTLQQGRKVTFARKRVWLRVGSGANLDVIVNGRRLLGLPESTGDVLVADGRVTPA